MTTPTIGFAGMTHLGLNSAVAGAERGFSMVAFDPDAGLIERLGRGEMPVLEPDLDRLAVKNAKSIRFTADPADLALCDVVYVAPDVATDDNGRSDLSAIDGLLERVFVYARDDAAIVVLSQVPPGYTRARGRPGRTLIYQVETLIFGRAIERALSPERYIVGLDDPVAPLPAAYRAYLEGHGNPPVLTMRYESAELAKISINCCLVASVSVANTLAELCERIGADWSEIVPALRLDRRIGKHAYLSAGLGISGGNLERDLASVLDLAAAHGTDAGVVEAWRANSSLRKGWSASMARSLVLDRNPDARIAVLGLTYKENTHSLKNSPAVACLETLIGADISVFDPAVREAPVPCTRICASIEDCVNGADALMILTPWPAFKVLDAQDLARRMSGRVLIDPYRCIGADAAVAAGFEYAALGAPVIRPKREPPC